MIEPGREGEAVTEGLGAPLLRVLAARRGQPTIVRMANGEEPLISDGTGWGRDIGDIWQHVIAECHPPGQQTLAFFYMSDVECLIDPDTGHILVSQTPAPGET